MMNKNNVCFSPGDSPWGLEATEVLWNHWGHGDSSTHYAGCDWTVWSLYSVQYPEEIHDCGRIPKTCQQQEVSFSSLPPSVCICTLCLGTEKWFFDSCMTWLKIIGNFLWKKALKTWAHFILVSYVYIKKHKSQKWKVIHVSSRKYLLSLLPPSGLRHLNSNKLHFSSFTLRSSQHLCPHLYL